MEGLKKHGKLRGGGYFAVHAWLRNHFGKADRCESDDCSGESKTYHWAKLHNKEYIHNRENFIRLCVSCHRKYDMTADQRSKIANTLIENSKQCCKHGHSRTITNTYFVKRISLLSGEAYFSPECRICRANNVKKYYLGKKELKDARG